MLFLTDGVSYIPISTEFYQVNAYRSSGLMQFVSQTAKEVFCGTS